MNFVLLGLLLVSVAFNIYLHMENKRLQAIVDHHSDALATHVKDTDDLEDDSDE